MIDYMSAVHVTIPLRILTPPKSRGNTMSNCIGIHMQTKQSLAELLLRCLSLWTEKN